MNDFNEKNFKAYEAIENADCVLIGGGAGLSGAAGLTYSGKRFTENFSDFKDRYGFEDMYSGTFYPFKTLEEHWAHWARHINVNLYQMKSTELYRTLLSIVKDKNYFVLTTNVESQFLKAGFEKNRIFEVQGNYGFFQCGKGCHNRLYNNETIVKEMVKQTTNCMIPATLIPKCPICGEDMDVNVRHNEYFVQDENWYWQQENYQNYIDNTKDKSIVYLEMGVGYNTPGIIRYPFEQMTYKNLDAKLIRFNRDYPDGVLENINKTIAFDEDILTCMRRIRGLQHA